MANVEKKRQAATILKLLHFTITNPITSKTTTTTTPTPAAVPAPFQAAAPKPSSWRFTAITTTATCKSTHSTANSSNVPSSIAVTCAPFDLAFEFELEPEQ